MITTSIEMVSPEYAKEILKGNVKNRALNARRVNALAAAIKRGEWMMNGDAVRISKGGRLLDGQHRLSAVAQSGETVEMLIIRGLDDSVFDTIDTGGRARGASDILQLSGVKNASVVAAAARMIFLYKLKGNPFHGTPEDAPTVTQIKSFCEKNEGIESAASFIAGRSSVCKMIPASVATFCLFAMREVNHESADEFMDSINSGEGLSRGDAALALRERLLNNMMTNKVKLSRYYTAALVIKAFRRHMAGEKVSTLRVSEHEKNIFDLGKTESITQ